MTDTKETTTIIELTQDEEREAARDDPNLAVRNAFGHWTGCNYGDWLDFSKCDCAEGLAGVPAKHQAMTVEAMPLRDYFAATVTIPWEEGVNLAAQENSERIAIGGGVTLAEVIEARCRLRYLEADAMIIRRAHPPREQFEAGKERGKNYGESLSDAGADDGLSTKYLCQCGHQPERHRARIAVGGQVATAGINGGDCELCDCRSYTETPAPQEATPE